jgi:DNA polymerase-3 subunit beta
VDKKNERLTLGGVCFDLETDGTCCAVATDGRRMAVKNSVGTNVNGHEFEPAILPVKTLKLLSKVLKDKTVHDTDEVKMAIHTTVEENGSTSGSVQFQCNGITLFSRLLDGRFPHWRSIIPKTDDRLHAQIRSETLLSAVNRMVTNEREPGVLFTFRRGSLTLESSAKESGQAKTAIPISFDGTADFVFDVSFIRDYLRALDADTVVDIFMAVDNEPVLFETGDGGYRYVVMPMERKTVSQPANAAADTEPETAEPEADTGVEVVGQESTEEAPMVTPMKKRDKSPCPDNDLETKVFQLLQENDQLQAKAEHYKALLERAMRVIEKMKAEQCLCA